MIEVRGRTFGARTAVGEARGSTYGSMRVLHLSAWVLREGVDMDYICEILEMDSCLDLFSVKVVPVTRSKINL